MQSKQTRSRELPPQGIRILCLDGGGLRGLLTIDILIAMEKAMGRKIRDTFHLIGGTSTGAIIALAIVYKIELEEIKKMYNNLGKQVFDAHFLAKFRNFVLTSSTYESNNLEKLLKEKFAEHKMNYVSSPKCFAVAATVNSTPPTSFIFRSYQTETAFQHCGTSSAKFWEALRASTAAKGYFTPFVYDHMELQDGGIVENNPTLIALSEASTLFPGVPIQCVVSVGTGNISSLSSGSSLSSMIQQVIDSATNCEKTHQHVASLLQQQQTKYFRLNPTIENISLDSISSENTRYLKTEATIFIEKPETQEIFQYLHKITNCVITVFEEIEERNEMNEVISNKLVFHEQKLRSELESLGPVFVVTLFGAVGTGKSTLENLLLKEEVFTPGHSQDCQTRGIQIYIKRSYDASVPSVMFVDTQGTGKEKGSRDQIILWLCHMVSNVLIYNIKDKLHRSLKQILQDIEVSKLMRQSMNSYLQEQKDTNISIKSAFENLFLVQRDVQPGWDPLHKQVQNEHTLKEVADFVKPEKCFSFPCPASEVPRDFKKLQLSLDDKFSQELTKLDNAIKATLASSVPFQGVELFRNWSLLWMATQRQAFEPFRKDQMQLYVDQYYAKKKEQQRLCIKMFLSGFLSNGPKTFSEVMAVRDPPTDISKEIDSLPAEVARKLRILYATEWERIMELNIQQNIDESFKDVKEKAQSGQVEDQLQLVKEIQAAESQVTEKLKGIESVERFLSYFCTARAKKKEDIQKAADYYFRQHLISEDYWLSRFRNQLYTPVQTPTFKSYQTFQETPFTFTPDPATRRENYRIQWSGGGRTSMGKSKAVYATVYDAQGNVVTGGGARHNNREAALDQANNNLNAHIQNKQQQDAARMRQESEQHQAAQQQAREAVDKTNSEISQENQVLENQYSSEWYGQLGNDFMWSGLRSLRASVIYVAVNPKQFKTNKHKVYFILSQGVIGGIAGVILPRVAKKVAELALEKTVLKTLQQKAPAMVGELAGVRGISVLVSTIITIIVHKIKNPEIPLQQVIATSCGNSTVSMLIGCIPGGFFVETLAEITFALGPWEYLFKNKDQVPIDDPRTEQQHDEFLQSLVAADKDYVQVSLVGANQEEDSFFINVGFQLFKLGKLQKDPTVDASATVEMREALCSWMNMNKNFRLGETEATSISLQDTWGQDFEERVESLKDVRAKVDPIIIWVVTEIYDVEIYLIKSVAKEPLGFHSTYSTDKRPEIWLTCNVRSMLYRSVLQSNLVKANQELPATANTASLEKRLDSLLDENFPQETTTNLNNAQPNSNAEHHAPKEENVVEVALTLKNREACFETLAHEFQTLSQNPDRNALEEARLTDITRETFSMFCDLEKMACPPSLEIRRQALLEQLSWLNNQIHG